MSKRRKDTKSLNLRESSFECAIGKKTRETPAASRALKKTFSASRAELAAVHFSMSFHKARKMRVFTAFITLALVGCVAAAPGGHQPLSRVNNVAQLFWRMAFGENAMPKAGTGIECAACTAGTP